MAIVPFLASIGKMAELVQGARLRYTLTPQLAIVSWSRKGRGFESHSYQITFCFCPYPPRYNAFCNSIAVLLLLFFFFFLEREWMVG